MIASNPIHKMHYGLDLGGFNILFLWSTLWLATRATLKWEKVLALLRENLEMLNFAKSSIL
jgi:hypothetical protein